MLYILSSSFVFLLLSIVCSESQKYELSAPSSICENIACNCSQLVSGSNRITVSCDFTNRDYTIDANSMPRDLDEFTINGGGVIIFEARSFSRLSLLVRIIVRNATSIFVKRESFVNLSTPNLEFYIIDVERVEIESKSFYLLRGPITYFILDCWSLTIHSDAMPWIRNLTVQDVKYVELHENAFSSTEKMINYHQGYSTNIVMQRISMDDLPKNSFPSSAAEIKLLECDIRVVHRNAFSALELHAVAILNSTFEVIQSEAFSERSLMRNLQLVNVKIERIRSGAVLSAVMNFKIVNSSIDVVEPEAFNMSTMVSFHFVNNVFGHVKRRGITLRGWTKAIIENNTLRDLDNEAINVPYRIEAITKEPSYFHFVGNILDSVKKHSLKLNIELAAEIVIKENIFIRACHCDWRSFLSDFVQAAEFVIDLIYDSSYCSVNSFFAKCFKHPEGFIRSFNFSKQVCTSGDALICEQKRDTDFTENPNISKAVDILNENKANQERFLVSVIVAIAIVGMFVTALFSVCIWFRGGAKSHAGCLISSISNMLLSFFSRLNLSNNINRVASANSITRVSVHEYAEVGPLKLLPGDPLDECIYICEDKATQTLPEELTQELLQTLRDKLDDPQNYVEARNMIEHLYDLIKVEECCNNNVLNDKFGEINFANSEGENENVYDVIKYDSSSSSSSKQRIRRYDKSFRTLAHKGTRAPSPDKLSPLTFTTSSFLKPSLLYRTRHAIPSISDYMEPSDRRSYIYSELLYDQCGPTSSAPTVSRANPPDVVLVVEYTEPRDYKVPIYSELADIANRPLPIMPYADSRESSQ